MNTKYAKEFFSFPDIIIMLILFVPLVSYTLLHALYFGTWIAFILGMATYALSEYVIHRFLFHMKTPNNPFLLKAIRRLHFDHHFDPNDLKLLFLPIWFSLPGFSLFAVIFYSITSDFQLMIAYLAGIVIYFLYYEWKHYIAHRPIQPRTEIGKKLKKAHLWHHFKNEKYWYGVTHTSVDKAFGTYKNQKLVEKSETAKNLEKRA
ncbi:fatty acid hydroxylase FAH1P [Sporosarcina newyorkensis 2681]|uniref:Fatty acid hydroxylase FAH1P n=1 Tax=Sporosarcina newyorkensis 2681 TaxID=1027292 RepID=F9DXM9_9BACL|nr:sterol desaturase family protein [Sporosarcina newyorkensis]EGQ20303.1 fatty acid hydroxylase FAH1P [Sporosarcina newyorkensis 2681]